MNMRVNKPDGGLVAQASSSHATSPLGSLLKTLADTVRKVLQALAPVLSRVNYTASMTNAAGRNPKVVWAGNLKPGQANTPQGQALIAKQERVLILLAQLLANSLANSDPAKAKENQVLTAQINAIILNDEATVAGQEAHDRGVEAAAAEQKHGAGSAEKPQLVPSGGGDWIQSNGQWVHPEVARARAAQSSAEARAVEARAKSDEATAQVDVYAADPEYRSAVAGANRTLAKTLAPEGITITIKPTKPLAQARTDLTNAQEVAGKATQSRQKREQAESVLLDALADKIKVRGPQGPNAQQARPANSPESSKVSERRSDYEDKEVRAGFAEYGQLSAEADLLDAEIGELVAQQLVGTTQPGTPERAEADKMLETAGNQRKVAEANRDVAVKASDLADAERDLAGVQLRAAPIEDAALGNLRDRSPHLFEADGFTDAGGKFSGSLQSVSVDDDPKDGQLYATFIYEDKKLVIPLTFSPGAKNVRRSGHERDIDMVWNNIAGCGPDGLLGAQQRKQAAEKAYTSSTITQIDVNIELAGKAIPALEKALGTALDTHGPAVPVGGPDETAPFPGAVKSTMNRQQVWVHPEVALILSALNATRDLDKDLRLQREHAVAWHDFAVFTATQPTKLLNEDSGQHQSDLQAAYYRGRQAQATHQIELTFGAMAQQALPDGKALFGAEHVLGGPALTSTLQLAGAAPEEAGRMADKIQEVGGGQAKVTFVPFQYIDASVGSQQMLFAIVRGTDGKEHVVDGRGSDYVLEGRKPENIKAFIETYQNDNDLADSGSIVVPKNLTFAAKDDKVETEAHQAHVKTFVEKYVDPVATGLAAGAPLLMLIPGVNVVAAPVAIAAGTYVGGRQLQEFGEDIYYGREITPGRLIMETLSAGATIFPATAAASRAIGLRNAGMTTVASLRTSIGATYNRTAYYRDAGAIMQGATGGAIGFARSLDLASIAAGAPLLAVSAFNMMAHGDDPGMNPLIELMSFASGIYGTASGLHAHIEQGRAAPQTMTQRPRHVATATTFTHHAPGTAALPSGLGGAGIARGGAPQNIATAAQPAAGSGGSHKNGGAADPWAGPGANRADGVVGEGAAAAKATPAVLPAVVDAVTAGQIVNSGNTTQGDSGNGAADQQARPGRTVEDGTAPDPQAEAKPVQADAAPAAASALPTIADAVAASRMADTASAAQGDSDGFGQAQQARPGRPVEAGTVRDPRRGDAGDNAPMPLWQQARQSPDRLALPADRRAEMEAAGGDIPPSGWQTVKPWKWQERAPDIRISALGRVRINPGPAGDAIRAMLGAQVDSTPVGSPTWRSYMAGVGVRSNVRAVGAAMGEGPGAVRDALQSEAGLSIRPNEHRNITGAQLGLPVSHQTAFQFKGADLIAAGEQLIYGDTTSPAAFDLLPKAGRIIPPARRPGGSPQGHVVEIVYGLSLRSRSVTLKPGETDVFGAPASNAAGFVRFEESAPYKKVMLEDKLYLHPAWVNELPTSVSKFVPRIALERRYEVAMDATFHQDFTVSRQFLDLNQAVLGKLRLRTQVVVANADDAAALAAAPSMEKLQELIAKGAIDQDRRLTYVRGSGSGLRQSAVPGLPLKETIVDLAGNERRVWSPGSSRLEVIVNEQFGPRGLINPDRPLLARAPTAFSHYVPSDGPIFWGLFGDKHNVALTVDRTLAWSVPALPVGVPGVRWLQLPLSASVEGRVFYRTKLPETAPDVAIGRTTSWEFRQADGLVLATEGPRWLKRINSRAETGRIATLPRGGSEALGKWLDGLEAGASPGQKEAIAEFRRTTLPALKDESFLTPEQASGIRELIIGQARPRTGTPRDGVVEIRPGALELPLKAWYETHGFTVEVSRRDPMPLWDAARQDLGTPRAGGETDGAGTGPARATPTRPDSPDTLGPHLWSVSSSHALDAATGPGYLRHLTDGTGAAPEDIIARIRARLEEEANRPQPRDLSAAARPQGGPNQQLIAKGRALLGQSPDKTVDGSLDLVLGYLAGAGETTPGYRQAIADLGHLVQHVENPGKGAFDARLQAVLRRAESFALGRALNPAAEWPLTVTLQRAAPQPAAAQQGANPAPAAPALPLRTAGSDALLSPDAASVIAGHGVSLMPNLPAKLRANKAFRPTPDDDRAVALFPQTSSDPGVKTRFALSVQLPADAYGQQRGSAGAGLRTADTQFFDSYADAAAAVANLPPPKGSLRGGFIYKVEAGAKDIAGIGKLAEIPADWLAGAQFVYRSGDAFPAIALRPVAGTPASQAAVVAATPAAPAPAPQPHVGQAAIANKGSTDPIAEARQSGAITVRPDYAGAESGLKKSFVDQANAYWRKKNANQKLPEPDDRMKAQTAYLAVARSPDDHALKSRPFHKKVTDYATRQVPHLFGSHDYTAIRYIEGSIPPQQIMGGAGKHPPLDLSDFTLHSTFEGAREAVQQRPAAVTKTGRKQVAPGGYVYRLVGPKDVLTEAIASGVVDPRLVEGGLRVFDDGSVYPYSVVNRDAAYAPKPGETFVKSDRPLEGKDKRRIVLTNVGYVGGAAFGAYMTARLGTGSHIGARDLLTSLAVYAWLYRGSIAGIRQGAKIRLQKRQGDAALVADMAHDKFKPAETLLDQLNRQVTGARGRRLGIAKPDRERYAAAIETVQQHLRTEKALPDDKKTPPDPAAMTVVREAVVDMAAQPLLGRRGFFHRVGNKPEVRDAAAALHQDPTQSAPWLTIADAHLEILARRTTGWRGAVWGHSRADRMNYLLAFETLRANRLDAEAMKVLETAPGRLIAPNTPTGRILEFARYASFGISNANTTRLVTNPFLDPAAYQYLGVLDSFAGAADLASNSASAAFLFGNLPGVVGTASKRGVGDADFNAPKKAAEELNAAGGGGNLPATPAQAQPAGPTRSGTAQAGPGGKKQKPHPTYAATDRGGRIIGPVRRFFAGAGDPRAVLHDGRVPDGPPEADGTQKYKPMYKPSLIQRWPQYASAGDAYGMVPFVVADSIHAANAFAAGQPVLGGIELLKVAADWYVFRGAQKDYIDEYRSNRGMGPIVWHSRVTDMFNAPLNGAERNPSGIDKPWLRYGLPPLVLLGAAVAVRVGLSLAFPWEPIEEPPQPDPIDTPPPDPTQVPAPGPVQTPPLPAPGGPNRPIAHLDGDVGSEPAGSHMPAGTPSMRFVTTREKANPDLAA